MKGEGEQGDEREHTELRDALREREEAEGEREGAGGKSEPQLRDETMLCARSGASIAPLSPLSPLSLSAVCDAPFLPHALSAVCCCGCVPPPPLFITPPPAHPLGPRDCAAICGALERHSVHPTASGVHGASTGMDKVEERKGELEEDEEEGETKELPSPPPPCSPAPVASDPHTLTLALTLALPLSFLTTHSLHSLPSLLVGLLSVLCCLFHSARVREVGLRGLHTREFLPGREGDEEGGGEGGEEEEEVAGRYTCETHQMGDLLSVERE